MRTTTEIVNYLTRYQQERAGDIQEDLLPERVDDLMEQMGNFLRIRLEEDTPFKNVWEDFINAPGTNADSLAGILESLFEAQPAVRARVDGFMRAVSAIESQQSDHEPARVNPEESLKAEPGGLVPDEGEASSLMADTRQEKNPPAYLYDNERAGFESDRQKPVSKPFMIGKNAQVIYIPDEEMKFPFMFMQLGQLTETSKDLNLQQKQTVQANLQSIRSQLTGEQPFDESDMGNAFETIWEVAPSYANALIESLQSHIKELPLETRDFIIQLHSPLH